MRERSAATRMREAYAALEAAELHARPPQELERLAAAFGQATAAQLAAEAVLRALDARVARGAG